MNKLKRREIIKQLDRLPFEIQIKILDLAKLMMPLILLKQSKMGRSELG